MVRFVLTMALALLSVGRCRAEAREPEAQSAAALPSQCGEWLAFAHFRLGAQPSAEQIAGWSSLLKPLIQRSTDQLVGPDDQRTLAAAADLAAAGHEVFAWITPDQGGATAVLLCRDIAAAQARLKDGFITRAAPSGLVAASNKIAIEKWGEEPPKAMSAASTEWPAHVRQVAQSRREVAPDAPDARGFEIAINANACRHAFPHAFDKAIDGRGQRLFDAMRVGNARVIGLHGRLITPTEVKLHDPLLPRPAGLADEVSYRGAPLLLLEASVSARSRPPGEVVAYRLTSGHWPHSALGDSWPGPSSAAAVVWRASLRPSIESLIWAYVAVQASPVARGESEPPGVIRRRGESIRALASAFEPWVVLGLQGGEHGRGLAVRLRTRAGAGEALLDAAWKPLATDLRGLAGEVPSGASPWWVHDVRRAWSAGEKPNDPANVEWLLSWEPD